MRSEFFIALRGWITLTATLSLIACGGGGSKPPESGSLTALAQLIQPLETSGQLPKLDRSSDIKGPDTDNNGIRDDIDTWIAALPITDTQSKATQQAARVMQRELLANTDDRTVLDLLGNASMAAVKCLGDSFKPEYQKGLDLSAQIEALTANTKARAKQYLAYNRARSGSVTELPKGNTCEP
jgi:hypothetical protein